MPEQSTDIFRQEALDHHQQSAGDKGDALRLSPFWIRWAYPVVICLSLAGILFICIFRMNEYASGPAVIHAVGRIDLTSPISATVRTVEVTPGEQVREGRELLRFESAQEQAEYARVNREFELQLVNFLRDPTDLSKRQVVAQLRVQRDFAWQRLDARSLRAPHAGVVSDIRCQPGQALSPGQVAMTLLNENPELKVVGLLPGHFRPQLTPGMPIRFELSGYEYAYQSLEIESVAHEVIGSSEALRFLGPGVGDAMSLGGPVIMVEARLARSEFDAGGRSYAYHDGMHATMEVRVRSEPIILSLIPGLKSLTEAGDE